MIVVTLPVLMWVIVIVVRVPGIRSLEGASSLNVGDGNYRSLLLTGDERCEQRMLSMAVNRLRFLFISFCYL